MSSQLVSHFDIKNSLHKAAQSSPKLQAVLKGIMFMYNWSILQRYIYGWKEVLYTSLSNHSFKFFTHLRYVAKDLLLLLVIRDEHASVTGNGERISKMGSNRS